MDYNELSPEDEALFEMSDEELEAAFKEAKANIGDEIDVTDEVEEDQEEIEVEDESVEEETEEDEDEEIEVEEDGESEQPGDEESDDENEDDEDEDEESDEDPDEDAEDTQESEDEESKPEPVEEEVYKYKANGQEFEFTDKEIKEQFGKVFGQAMNYTKKMQALSEGRKTLSALKDNDISHEDVNLMIDVLKGDKDALASVMKRSGVDAMELDTEDVQYAPKEYGRSDQEIAIDDVIDGISGDPEYSVTQHVVDRQWDGNSRKALAENPKMIQGLHNDIKSGVYDKVSPLAMKLKAYDGGQKSDIEYYIEAGSKYYADLQSQEDRRVAAEQAEAERLAKVEEEQKAIDAVKAETAKRKTVKKAANKRKNAAPTKKAAGTKDVIDYLDDSDEAFDEWYKKLESQR